MTADKFLDRFLNEEDLKENERINTIWLDSAIEVMNEYAKYHVKLALKEAAKKTIDIHHDIADLPQNCNDYEESVILFIENCYDLNKIK